MRLWFAPGSDVPLYRQLVQQVSLAILCGDLQPGERLPSTRELARRYAIHPNTVSAGYRELERAGWTETRKGSGVYVRSHAEPSSTPEQILDVHIAGFFRAVRQLNLPADVVRARVAEWLAAPPPDHLLVIDPDPEMRRILLTEVREATAFPARESAIDAGIIAAPLTGAIPVCRPSKTDLVRAALPAGVELITLQISSATSWLDPWLPAPKGHLLGIASRWPEFLDIARTMLAAAGVPADALIFCDAKQPQWHRGLNQASAILCDAYTATLPQFPAKPTKIIFRLLSDQTCAQLSSLAIGKRP